MRLAVFFAFLVMLGVATAVLTYPSRSEVSYSAFRIIGGPGPAMVGWVYHDDGKERFELVRGGRLRIYIHRPDLGKAIIVDPETMTGEVVPIDDSRVDFGFWRLRELAAEAQGQETINGETVTRFVAIDRYNKPQGYWLTDDGIPLQVVRTYGIESTTIRLINLQRGRQAGHLFEVPEGIDIISKK